MANMVEARLLNENFELEAVLDVYESFIWTERYSECGDFELYTYADKSLIDILHTGMYVQLPDSEYTMVVETISLDHDYETGPHLTIKGRSLESILDRRIVWDPIAYKNVTIGGLIKTLIYAHIINPSNSARRIPNFIFADTDTGYDPISDPDGYLSKTIDAIQLFGENLYDLIVTICQAYKIGFKITPENGNIVFRLYVGVNRSYEQDINPYVTFSPEYDNLLNSNYVASTVNYKNSCLVGGDGEGDSQTRVEVRASGESGYYTGLDRREVYSDQSSLNTNGDEITKQEYLNQLCTAGKDVLSSLMNVSSFDAQINPTQFYEYGVDYKLGDIVQIVNEFKMESVTRVTEYIRSYSTSGIEAYPTFTGDLDDVDTGYSTVNSGSSSLRSRGVYIRPIYGYEYTNQKVDEWENIGVSITVPANHTYYVTITCGYTSGRPTGAGFHTSSELQSWAPSPIKCIEAPYCGETPVFRLVASTTYYLFVKRAGTGTNKHWVMGLDFTNA